MFPHAKGRNPVSDFSLFRKQSALGAAHQYMGMIGMRPIMFW